MELKLNPKNPRVITKDKLKLLMDSIKQFPKMLEIRPIVVNKDMMIIGGNMRYRALQELKWEIKPEWVKVADGLTTEEVRRFIVEDNIGFGSWDWDLLGAEYPEEELLSWGIELETKKKDDFYTREIKVPIYEPVNEKPLLEELIDEEKTKAFIKEIEESDVDEEVKDFLKKAANRHNIFSYKKIADFYAHSDEKTKDLMEKLALVIIDYGKAVENGYIKMVQDIMTIQSEDYEE